MLGSLPGGRNCQIWCSLMRGRAFFIQNLSALVVIFRDEQAIGMAFQYLNVQCFIGSLNFLNAVLFLRPRRKPACSLNLMWEVDFEFRQFYQRALKPISRGSREWTRLNSSFPARPNVRLQLPPTDPCRKGSAPGSPASGSAPMRPNCNRWSYCRRRCCWPPATSMGGSCTPARSAREPAPGPTWGSTNALSLLFSSSYNIINPRPIRYIRSLRLTSNRVGNIRVRKIFTNVVINNNCPDPLRYCMGALLNKLPRNQQPKNFPSVSSEIDEIPFHSIVTSSSKQTLLPKPSKDTHTIERKVELGGKRSKQVPRWYARVYFTPESSFIIGFKFLTLVLIYLYFLEIPLTIAFEYRKEGEDSEKFFKFANIPTIVVFLLGVIIKTKTSYYKEGILISGQREILINYLIYGFVFDFLSIAAIIVYEFCELIKEKSENQDPNRIRFIVVLFYLKLPEVLKIQQSIVSAFDLKRRVKAFFKLSLLLVKVFMLTNIVGCCFFWVSNNVCDLWQDCEMCCWISRKVMYGTLRQQDWQLQYAFSLYWASTTMLTIGYGDVTPQNIYEVVYTVAAQFISCVLFAFSVNQIWDILQEKNSKHARIHARMNVINVYMRDKNVDAELKSRINAYLSHFYHTKNLREKEIEGEIISELTPSLKKQLYFQSYGFLFKKHPFFNMFSAQTLEQASENIREVGFFEQELVYEPFNECSMSLMYIHKGELESLIELGNRANNVNLENFQAGRVVGLYQFVRQTNYCSSLMAVKYSLLYVLDYANWRHSLAQNEVDMQNYFIQRHNILYERNNSSIGLLCKLCGSVGHPSDLCLHEEINSRNYHKIQEYKKQAYRTQYHRKNKAMPAEYKCQVTAYEPNALERRRVRKNSMQRRQSMKHHSNKKKIPEKKSHTENISRIISKNKIKQSMWEEESEFSIQMIMETNNDIEGVQNYETYWPVMNATVDLAKERRRNTFLVRRLN